MTGAMAAPSAAIWPATAAAIVVMGLGGLMTERSPWFQSLAQPDWQPPGWLFGPVWAVILALTLTAFVVAWRRAPRSARSTLVSAYGVNALLNALWTPLFFQLQRPDWALLDVALLWASIVVLIVTSARHAAVAGLLLAPYLAWVSFAALLNLEIVRLNGPFM